MQDTPPPSAVQLDVQLLFQIIGELFVENYARKRQALVDANQGLQAGGGGIRESEPASTQNNKMPYESMSAKVSRQDRQG